MQAPSVVIVLLTLNASSLAEDFILRLQAQSLKLDTLFVIDSNSNDNTRDIFDRFGASVLLVEQSDFDHGSTRQIAVDRYARHSDIVVYMTQDAFLACDNALEKLLDSFKDQRVGAAYGRQLPRKGANPIEAHARIFNYPSESSVKGLEDSKQLGIKTCFMSNSFAAYRSSVLEQVGGFPKKNIVSEETYVAAKILEAGWKIKYCADATVFHSHNYTIRQELQRYFDIGVFHSRESWIRKQFGQAEGEGKRFVKSQISYLRNGHHHLIPSALLRMVFKYLGFRLGFYEAYLPNRVKMWLSMQKSYWI